MRDFRLIGTGSNFSWRATREYSRRTDAGLIEAGGLPKTVFGDGILGLTENEVVL